MSLSSSLLEELDSIHALDLSRSKDLRAKSRSVTGAEGTDEPGKDTFFTLRRDGIVPEMSKASLGLYDTGLESPYAMKRSRSVDGGLPSLLCILTWYCTNKGEMP